MSAHLGIEGGWVDGQGPDEEPGGEPTPEEIEAGEREYAAWKAGLEARGWREESCGCCAGLEWGGEEPRECKSCNGSGGYWRTPKGHYVQWPGGPFCG